MALYNMNYSEFLSIIDENIGKNSLLREHRAELITALSFDFNPLTADLQCIQETVELWNNQLAQASNLRMGDYYITIQGIVIELVEFYCSSGLLEFLVESLNDEAYAPPPLFNVAITIAIGIWKLFENSKKLEDRDFCLYQQAVNHKQLNRRFTKADIESWFSDSSFICNVPYKRSPWNCSNCTNSTCRFLENDMLDSAIESLCKKGVLIKREEGTDEDKQIYYEFF